MNNVSHRNNWNLSVSEQQVDPPPTPLIKSKMYMKRERDYVKIKLHRNYMSETLDIYEFKMDLFENGKP